MCMNLTREDVLRSPQRCAHVAHLYVDEESLYDAVELFAGAAIERGEAVVLIATEAHLEGVLRRLAQAGRDVEDLIAAGQMQRLDADDAIAQIMCGKEPDHAAFERIARGAIERALTRFPQASLYGELADVLWKQRNRPAAHQLEKWWNELLAEFGCPLLCSYYADVFDFDEGVQAGLDDICRTHSHLIPVEDAERLDRALNAALATVFHNGDAKSLREHLVRRRRRATQMPEAQRALLGLHEILPSLAQEVRMVARAHYLRETVCATA